MSITRQGVYSQQKASPYKTPCRVASTANIASLSGLLTVDTVTVSAGDRVLVWQQSTPSENNIYIAASGSWTAAVDMSLADDLLLGTQVYVYDGSAYKDKSFHLTDDSPITFVQTEYKETTVNLAVGGWSTSTQTETITGLTATSDVIVYPPVDRTAYLAYGAAQISATATGTNTITFTCTTTPTADIDNVIVLWR